MTPGDREQPWRDDATERGRVVLLTDNPISRAVATIAGAVGHEVVVITDDDGGPGLGDLGLRAGDAVVLCDHDAPDAAAVHNLGGKGPGEIALSVVAEIVAEAHGRPGGPLRDPGT
jgi:xanthine/CO dehydrogenase XdhC/CoxF family maturation factor